MTKTKLISFIKRDIKKLDAAQNELKKKLPPITGKKGAPIDYTYTIIRKHTLKEILEML